MSTDFQKLIFILNFIFNIFILVNCAEESNILNDKIQFSKEDEEILKWTPPAGIQSHLPYHLLGYDKEDVPVWYLPLGKWKLRQLIENGKTVEMDKYTNQFCVRLTSPQLVAKNESLPDTALIVNMEGFGLEHIVHVPTVEYYLRNTKTFVETIRRHKVVMKELTAINVNYIFQMMLNILAPLLHPISRRIQVYGTHPEKWKRALLENLSRDQLPELLGGFGNHTYLQSYD